MIKIVWLTQYNVLKLLPEIALSRRTELHNSSWIHSLSDQLALNEEVELHIITHSQLVTKSQFIKKGNIFFHVIKYSFPLTNRGFPWYLPIDKLTAYDSFSNRAQKLIYEIKPDLLHIHGTEGGYSIPALKTNIPVIISIQGIISEYVKINPSFVGFLQSLYEKNAIRKARYFGCRTNFDHDFVKKINKNAIIFDLPEAMNNVFYEHKWKRPSELSLLFVGSINKRKGIIDLIYAMIELKNSFPEITLKIIGSGAEAYLLYLNTIIEKHNLTRNIIWMGTKSPSEVARELSQSSFFVLPSLMDNSPNCLAEAMAVGIPSIATKVGGIPSMIKDSHDGILTEKQDAASLANIIQRLVGDIELQDKLSMNARITALRRNFPPVVSNIYVNVYNSIINGPAKNLDSYSLL